MKKLFPFLFSLISVYSMAGTDPMVAYTMMMEGKAALIDVREKHEIEAGMVKGALWFPLSHVRGNNNWKADFEKLVGDKEPLFIYCRSGRRSENFRKILEEENIPSENLGGFQILQNILPTINQ
ncbi:MAG: rhodanese-like domain-containing protein [Bacteriovoracia bacterium]